jgi:branched-chain amino acid transport system substrate-binding protein
MTQFRALALAAGFAATAALSISAATARAEQIDIGMMLTLSGPPAALGTHIRDGFQLALEEKGGQLGGFEVNLIVVDDELKPDVAVGKAKALVERDGADIVVGTVFSNVMMAVFKPVIDAGVVLVSPNAGPAPLAGRGCHPHYFNVAWQNDGNHEVIGRTATEAGYERLILVAPNYQAGKDGMAGVKRFYEGEVVDEIFTQLGQLDFSAELARIAAAKPDAVYAFMPGGMGVNLVRQFDQAGLEMPFLSAFTVDETTLPATQDAALGLLGGSQWARDLDNPVNAAFVPAFEAKYGYAPSLYASQGYDAALILDAALSEAGTTEADALSAAMKAVNVETTRGAFRFGSNNFPVQDYHLVEAVKDGDAYVMRTVRKVFEAHADAYAEDCRM